MPNSIKYSTTGDTLSLEKGNIFFGVGDVGKGPSSATTYYNGVTPSAGGYTIYSYNASQTSKLSFHSAANDTALREYTNNISGQSFASAAQCLNWYATQTNYVCVNRDYEGIVTSGLTFIVDAGFTPSYTTSGTTWYDLGYNNYNGTLVNGPTFSTDGGGTIVFDSVDDEVNTSYGPTLGDFTICIWFKDNTSPQYGRLVDKSYTGGFWLGRNDNNANSWGGGIKETSFPYGRFLTLTDGQWNYLVSTRSGTTHTLYGNGIINTTSGTVTSSNLDATTFAIGAWSGSENSQRFKGNIAIVQVYNRSLSPTEVLQNYNAQKSRFQASFDPDAQAFITAAGITDSTQQTAINQLVLDLKSYNIWSSMVAIYPFVGGTANTNKYNLKNTSTYTLSFGGGWTHSSTGSLPNGTNAYADTGIAPNSVLGSSYNYSVYSRTNTNNNGTIIGVLEIGGYTCGESGIQSGLELYLRTSDFLLVRDQPNGGYFQISNTSSLGYYIVNRTGTLTVFKNGTSIGSTTVSQSIPNSNLSLGASFIYDNDCGYGYYDYFDNKEISFATFANASLTSTNISNLNTAVQAFQTTLGRQV